MIQSSASHFPIFGVEIQAEGVSDACYIPSRPLVELSYRDAGEPCELYRLGG